MTVWVTFRASSPNWTTWPTSGSRASGCHPSRCRPTATGATTWPTTATSIPTSAPWPISTPWSARRADRGIRILMDLVPNHTSDQHSWFVDARSGPDAEHRDWYVWADPKPDGSPPNNWLSVFGGSAWELDEASGQYYLHNFEAQQPDLNWWSEDVRGAFDDIVRFWWDRGVSGFRIDVCNMMIKDAELRDNPPATEDDPLDQQLMGLRAVYNSDRPEAHDILQRWRTIADGYETPPLLIGETNVEQLTTLMEFYGDGRNELHGGFNFVFINADLEADAMRRVVEDTEALLPEGAWPIWTGSNHDVSRLATRWAGGDVAKVRCALLILLTLRGTAFLYQGDEIGLTDGPIAQSDLHDAVGIRFWPYYKGRDPERTPMPWSNTPGGGFTSPGVTPWLPMGDPAACNVADQEADVDSVLAFTRRAIAGRRHSDDLAVGLVPLAALARRHLGLRPGRADGGGPEHVGAGPTGRGNRDHRAEHRTDPGGHGGRRRTHVGPVDGRRHHVVTARRFLLCSTPAQGHTAPLLAVARRLVEGGHHVTFFTTEHYRHRVNRHRGALRPVRHRLRRPRPDGGQSRTRGLVGPRRAGRQGRPATDLRRPPRRAVRRPHGHPRGLSGRRHRDRHHVLRCAAPRPGATGRPARPGHHRGHAPGHQQSRHRALRCGHAARDGRVLSPAQPRPELGHRTRGAARHPAAGAPTPGRVRRATLPRLLHRPATQGGGRLPPGDGAGIRVPAHRPAPVHPLRRSHPGATVDRLRPPALVG